MFLTVENRVYLVKLIIHIIICSIQHLYVNNYKSVIGNHQKIKPTQRSMNWCVDQQSVYIHTVEY